MSDWAVGDLAVCVDSSDCGGLGPCGPIRLREGAVYLVIGITTDAEWRGGLRGIGLIVDGAKNDSPDGDWLADRFRKVVQDKHEACETEFVTLLQRIKRKQVA